MNEAKTKRNFAKKMLTNIFLRNFFCENCVLYSQYFVFLINAKLLHFFKIPYFFATFSHFFAKEIEAKFRETFFASEGNAEKYENFREKCEIFVKRFSLLAGNPNCYPFTK